ncbi:hypothetical protein F5879DRAFT_993823 [Lentinula edodes]|nr:hypothetical protein F5879DRAFT_993823 [Lentinula edodes]
MVALLLLPPPALCTRSSLLLSTTSILIPEFLALQNLKAMDIDLPSNNPAPAAAHLGARKMCQAALWPRISCGVPHLSTRLNKSSKGLFTLSSPSTGQMRERDLPDLFELPSSLTSTTQYLNIYRFDLGHALMGGYSSRMEVDALGPSLGDEGVEFENGKEKSAIPSPPPRVHLPPPSVSAPSLPTLLQTLPIIRHRLIYLDLRSVVGNARALLGKDRPIASDATPIKLKPFDTSFLPATSN